MIGSSDEATVMELLAPLRQIEPVPFAAPERAERRRLRRPVLAAAVVAAALGLAGVAIADGVGAFNGIGVTQHPQTSADVIDSPTLARLRQNCSATPFWTPQCHLVLGSSRLIGHLPDGGNLYVVTDTRDDLCVIEPSGMSCGTGLSRSRPVSESSIGQILYGVAIDGVTSVSFEKDGQEVSIPVKDNAWVYQGASLEDFEALTAHFADGTTVTLHS